MISPVRWAGLIVLLAAVSTSSSKLWAQNGSLNKIVASPQNISENQAEGEVIIDIRTLSEWQDTGVVDGAIPLEFFDGQGQYDVESFIHSVESMAPRGTRIGIICRTASRSGPVSQLMAEHGWQVTDYQGGMVALSHHGYQTVSLGYALDALQDTPYCGTPLGSC